MPSAEPSIETVDVREVINDTVAFNRVAAQQRKQMLNTVFNESVPQFLETDPVRMQQKINNLISNAIKVLDEKSNVTVRVDFRQKSLQVLVEETKLDGDEEEAKEFFFPQNILAREIALNNESQTTFKFRRSIAQNVISDESLINQLDPDLSSKAFCVKIKATKPEDGFGGGKNLNSLSSSELLVSEIKTKIFVYANNTEEFTELELVFGLELQLKSQTTVFMDASIMLHKI
jgi:light-regulated signal transduction histidine kinase (bacteriophytochrome)